MKYLYPEVWQLLAKSIDSSARRVSRGRSSDNSIMNYDWDALQF